MKKKYLIEIDTETKRLTKELMKEYSFENLQTLLREMNSEVLKE